MENDTKSLILTVLIWFVIATILYCIDVLTDERFSFILISILLVSSLTFSYINIKKSIKI